MNGISIPGLRYAAAVARLGSFSAAARECGVSQPTVSNAIADLEEAVGARLFVRSTRRLTATPAGLALMPLVDNVLTALGDLERGADRVKKPTRKLLRVGFSQLVGAQRLALLFEPFVKTHSDVELIYKECSQNDMETRLEASTADVVCGTNLARARNRSRQLLVREPLRYIVPNNAAPPERITLREIARARLVLTDGSCGLAPMTRELFARARIAIDEYAGHAISYAALEDWAELGIGGAILPISHIRKSRSAPVVQADKPVLIAYEAVWRADLLVAAHAKEFVGYLRRTVPRIVQGFAA